jgi:hypothetical protein
MEMTITGSHVIKTTTTTSELQLRIASSDFGAKARFFADKCCHTLKKEHLSASSTFAPTLETL